MFKIGNVQIKNEYVIAPMLGVNCNAFYRLFDDVGMIYSPMIMYSKLDEIGIDRIKEIYLDFNNLDCVKVGQICGNLTHINKLITLVRLISDYVDIIDFNACCPMPHITGDKSGAYLMKETEQLYHIIDKLVSVSSKPITVKMLLGYDKNNALEVAMKLQELGVSAIAITPKLHKGNDLDYDTVKLLKEKLKIPVIYSGGIYKPGNVKFILSFAKVDAVMFASGIKGNPLLYYRSRYLMENDKNLDYSKKEFVTEQNKFISKFKAFYKEQKNQSKSEYEQHLKWLESKL